MATGSLVGVAHSQVVAGFWVVAGFQAVAGFHLVVGFQVIAGSQMVPGFQVVPGYRVIALAGTLLPCHFPWVWVGGVVGFSSVGWTHRHSR